LIDFSFFKSRNFSLGLLVSTASFVMFFGSMVLLPLWLQLFQHYTAFWAGVAIAPVGLCSLFLSPLVGYFLYRVDLRLFTTFSFCIFALSFFWFGALNTEASLMQIIHPRLLQGVGVACFFIPLVTLSLSDIEPAKLPSASGLYNFVRILMGGGVGTSLFVALFNRRQFFHQSRLLEGMTPFNENLSSLSQQIGFDETSCWVYLKAMVANQGAMMALCDVFWLCAVAFLVLIPLVWLCRPSKVTSSVSSALH
jgi:DHA2 family multidrug resistance protein